MTAFQIASAVLIGLGALLMLTAAFGVVRLPDLYTRLHAAGKGDTLGQSLVLAGLALVSGSWQDAFKLGLIVLFVFVVNPTATHALAHAAWIAGLRPWRRGHLDQRQYEGQMSDADRREAIVPIAARPRGDEDGAG